MNKKLKRLYIKLVILILCFFVFVRIVTLVLSKYESEANSTANVDVAFYLINEDYKTIEFQSIKYFHNINKLYNIAGDSMVELAGAYNLLYFILEMNKAGYLRDSQDLVDICMVAMDNKANYRYYDTNFIITSAMFNYGVAEYNFATGKIHKGVSIEKSTFEEFKKYVFGVFSK